jgi:hypothetical protein
LIGICGFLAQDFKPSHVRDIRSEVVQHNFGRGCADLLARNPASRRPAASQKAPGATLGLGLAFPSTARTAEPAHADLQTNNSPR